MQPYEIQWRTDVNGTPTSVAIEEQFVVKEDLSIVLEEIPDKFQRVSITLENGGRIYEVVNRNELVDNRFYVDYNSGIIYFDSSLLNKIVVVAYYGRGFKRISASRIFGLEPIETKVEVRAENEDDKRIIDELQHKVKVLELQIEFLVSELEKLIK